jgi:hypothetical protein
MNDAPYQEIYMDWEGFISLKRSVRINAGKRVSVKIPWKSYKAEILENFSGCQTIPS